MSGVSYDKLVRMAEQIAANNDLGDHDAAAVTVANHINKYWDPRMRKTVLEYAARPDAQMSATVRSALTRVRT